jgi:hypothetical protein
MNCFLAKLNIYIGHAYMILSHCKARALNCLSKINENIETKKRIYTKNSGKTKTVLRSRDMSLVHIRNHHLHRLGTFHHSYHCHHHYSTAALYHLPPHPHYLHE